MLGLTYIRKIYGFSMDELAIKLEVSKQTISKWENLKIPISLDRVKQLSEIFSIPENYFSKELNEIEKLEVQKIKIINELKPVIVGYEQNYEFDKRNIISVPIYNTDKEIKQAELQIEKIKVVEGIKELINNCNSTNELDKFRLFLMLLKSDNTNQNIVKYTIEAVCHYYGILPDWVTLSDTDGVYYMRDLTELISRHEEIDFKSPKPNRVK